MAENYNEVTDRIYRYAYPANRESGCRLKLPDPLRELIEHSSLGASCRTKAII